MSSSPEYLRNRRRAKLSLGLCGRCGSKPAREGKTTCQHCFDNNAADDANRHMTAYQKAKLEGRCVSCLVVPPRPGFTRCHTCATREAATSKRFMLKAVANGLCRRCLVQGQIPGLTICRGCSDQAREAGLAARALVLGIYGDGHCAQCPESRDGCLSIDHIDDNGSVHRKDIKIGGGWKFYRWLIRHGFPSGYQVLCMNCQFLKEAARRERLRNAGTPLFGGKLAVNGRPQRRRNW